MLRTRAVTAWLGREVELEALPPAERETIAARWAQARTEGRGWTTWKSFAGQDCGLIHEVLPAAEVVRRIVEEAEQILGRWGSAGRSAPCPLR